MMLIEMDKYQPNTLRKGRIQALEQDLSESYGLFSNRMPQWKQITIKDFTSFWEESQLKHLFYCKGEDQDEEEYFLVLSKILINDYFMKDTDSKKVYCLLSLYFLTYSLDNNGDRNFRSLYVNPDFINQLVHFIKRNAADREELYFKIIPKLQANFIYSIKTGLRNPLVKKNGETFNRFPNSIKKVTKENYSETIFQIKEMLPSLEGDVKSYQDEKQKFFKKYKEDRKVSQIKKEMHFDKNICFRIDQMIKSYDSQVKSLDMKLEKMESQNAQ